jgi:1-acyl-sn-glycerol-3-phosphate acyltransferase
MGRERLGLAYRLCVVLLRPPLMVLTKRDWRGGERVPAEGGFVVVTNHISYLDPITFAHFLYDNGRVPRFLAKAPLFTIPVVGWVVRNSGQIPVHRESRNAAAAFTDAVAAVEAGACVAIYPEGTITRDPDGWPMLGKTGAARVALTTGCPLIPVAQWGVHEILRPYGKPLPRFFPRRTMRVAAGPPVDLDDLRGRALTPDVLREATDRIMAAITALLGDLRGELPPAKRYDPKITESSSAPPTKALPTKIADPESAAQ